MESRRIILNLVQQIRLLSVKQREPYLLFRKILGFYPFEIRLYEQALRHKSVSLHTEEGLLLNNERLEFLGDAVLNVLVADILFHRFKNEEEDFLSKTRSKIVQRNSLNKIAMKLGLDKLIKTSTPANLPHNSIYGNALEALIGAIYIDQGYRRCKYFLEKRIIERYVDIEKISSIDANFKSILIEWSQRQKLPVRFDTEELQNQGKNTTRFKALAFVKDNLIGEGEGFSKKEAQQKAAKMAVAKIDDKAEVLNEILKGPI